MSAVQGEGPDILLFMDPLPERLVNRVTSENDQFRLPVCVVVESIGAGQAALQARANALNRVSYALSAHVHPEYRRILCEQQKFGSVCRSQPGSVQRA